MQRLDSTLEDKLIAFAQHLVDQRRARVIIRPKKNAPGHWFGGGNMVEDVNGHFYVVGRYRNQGDSRVGLAAGERGLELAIFRSNDRGNTFAKVASFTKADLSKPGREVLSIEGSALHWTRKGVELFVSSEKAGIGYPSGLEAFLKPGCGVWTIERMTGMTIEQLQPEKSATVIASRDPEALHVKDPHCYELANGDLVLMYCTHPFNWSSSNTAFLRRRPNEDELSSFPEATFPRGMTWDVAISRGTCLMDVPQIGAFSNHRVTLLFYDGGESLRNLDEHEAAVQRPRGYSCEELGGLAYFLDGEFSHPFRLARTLPLFISPHGTGCSRYVDVLKTREGFYATWQQSQADYSQPLVMNFVSQAEAAAVLSS